MTWQTLLLTLLASAGEEAAHALAAAGAALWVLALLLGVAVLLLLLLLLLLVVEVVGVGVGVAAAGAASGFLVAFFLEKNAARLSASVDMAAALVGGRCLKGALRRANAQSVGVARDTRGMMWMRMCECEERERDYRGKQERVKRFVDCFKPHSHSRSVS
jgi:hypothetical protein